MAESRVTQVIVEVLSPGGPPNARTTIVVAEVLHAVSEQLAGAGGQKPIVVVVAG